MAERAAIRSFVKLGWTAALVGLAVLLFAASATAKGPPSGKGGPPPWAGSGASGGGPPAWAGGAGKGAATQKAKGGAQKGKGAEKKAAKAGKALEKAEKKRAKAREAKDNPAWTCFGLMIELGDAFAETFGTNENKANAFGQCVAEQAREQGEGSGEEDDAEEPTEEPTECEEPAESQEPAEGEDATAELTSLDDDPPAGDACEHAEEETGEDAEDGEEETGGEERAGLTCFVAAAAARANPFAVCVRS